MNSLWLYDESNKCLVHESNNCANSVRLVLPLNNGQIGLEEVG